MTDTSPTSRALPQIVAPKRFADSRGWLSETFREDTLRGLGIPDRFVQDNQSYSQRAGTLRGLHFQVPPAAQAKLIGVLRGKILDVAVDIRKGSPTYGKHVSVELSADSGHQLYIPVGFAHGFLTLEDNVTVMYKISDYYSPAHDRGVRWNDPNIGVAWPGQVNTTIVSEKDAQLPFLKEFDSPFAYNGYPLEDLTVTGTRSGLS